MFVCFHIFTDAQKVTKYEKCSKTFLPDLGYLGVLK